MPTHNEARVRVRIRRARAVLFPALFILPMGGTPTDPPLSPPAVALRTAQAGRSLIDELRPVRVLGTSVVLYKIRDVDTVDDMVVVLTKPGPAVHVFVGRDHFEWGREGGGPGEFGNPVAIRLTPRRDALLIAEAQPGRSRVARFTLRGELVREHRVAPLAIVTQIELVGDQLIVQGGELGGERIHVVRLATPQDTVFSFPRAREINIQTDEGPTRSFPVFLPHQARPQWTGTAKGLLALWDGRSGQLLLLDTKGDRRGTIPLELTPFAIQASDRDRWYEKEFPADFIGRRDDPLRVIRKKARDDKLITFPSHFPRALDLKGDVRGGVWVKRTPAARGEVWSLVGDGSILTARFPPGREVQSFGRRYVVATAVDETLGTELVELYALSDVKKQREQGNE